MDGAARFVLLERLGHVTPGHPVPEAALRRALERQRALKTMTEKPPLWADLLLTLWVLVVAVIFFGVYFVPPSASRRTRSARPSTR